MFDPDEFAIAVSGASLRADFLGRQGRPTLVEQFQTPEWTIDYQEAEVRARIFGCPPPGWSSVALIRGDGESSWYGSPVRRGFLVCTPPGEPIDGWIGSGFVCSSICVPPRVWERCRLAAGVERERIDAAVFGISGDRFASIERRLLHLRRMMKISANGPEAPLAAREAEAFVSDLMTLVWELGSRGCRSRESPRNRARLARRAEEWLHRHHGTALGIDELALAMGTSRRELEYAFRDTFAMSPRQFLEKIRLNAIRRELRRSAPERRGHVTRIALDHGIIHLGRFPALYRQLFGELPSETAGGLRQA